MPSPIVAANLIRSALGLTNSVGVDQTLTSQETADCLSALNDIYEELSTEGLALWDTQNQTFATIAGQATYSIGTGGNWATSRPVRINAAYCTFGGVDFAMESWDQETYNLVGLKTQQQPIVQRYLWINDFPLSWVTLWPVPAQVIPIVLTIDNLLTNITSASQSLTFPHGYSKLFLYKLAVDIAPIFGKVASDDIKKTAVEMMAKIKRMNAKTPVSRFDGALVDSGPVVWQRGY